MDRYADFLPVLRLWEVARSGLGSGTARACAAAHALFEGGYIARTDLHELTVEQAWMILDRARRRITEIDKAGDMLQHSPAEIEQMKREVGRAVASTAEEVRRGDVAPNDIGIRLDAWISHHSQPDKPEAKLDRLAYRIANDLARILARDAYAEKLKHIVKQLDKVTREEDKGALRLIDYELEQLGRRAEVLRRKLAGGAYRPRKRQPAVSNRTTRR